jgi:maltooligosyltrehalose trehalohydrolase
MRFGARWDGERTRFALWAPAARDVALRLERPDRTLPMARDADGWATIETEDAPPGTRYRFVVDCAAGQGLGRLLVPDPASRFQPEDVHGASEVIDPAAFEWPDDGWPGVPAERLVVYELHVGTFTPEGTFDAVAARLDHLVDLGVTAVELMPVADFPGRRGWGYDGVLPFAPDSVYGRPEDLKRLVAACHRRGLAVLLDVVYNHFGPEGNYLHVYAPAFSGGDTPWGAGLDLDAPAAAVVRAFIIDNARYWLEEYHVDGLRLDAVHAIRGEARRGVLVELARTVAAGPGRSRHVHLVLENDENDASYLARDPAGRPLLYLAQWNDDLHHALHVLVTGQTTGYYGDYHDPVAALGRCLAEGFAYQGEASAYRGRRRGTPSAGLPPTAFVGFVQNHDQVGNRAFGERLTALAPAAAVRAATAVVLLAPAIPLLFMGQEWGAAEPFLFFSDLAPELGPAVREGRRREFARFPEFADPAHRERIPDPQAIATRDQSVLDWGALARAPHAEWLAWHRMLLGLRHRHIVPLLAHAAAPRARFSTIGATGLEVAWVFAGGQMLRLAANLGAQAVPHAGPGPGWGRRLHALAIDAASWTVLPPWAVAWYLAG